MGEHPQRRSTVGAIAIMVLLLVGCTDSSNDVRTDDMTNAVDRVRELAQTSAHTTLVALELDADTIDGASRVVTCTDSLGKETDQRFGEYSSGQSIGSDSVSDEQISALEPELDVTFLEDSTDSEGTRLVSFVLVADDVDVVVRVSLAGDGSATLTSSTPCLD